MMTALMTYTGRLVITSCWCGIHLAVPEDLYRQAKLHKGKAIYCPLGHTFVFTTTVEDENESLKARLESERKWGARMAEQVDQERLRVRALKGVVTKTRNRAAHGVCPACTRTFTNVQRHIESQHPLLLQSTALALVES